MNQAIDLILLLTKTKKMNKELDINMTHNLEEVVFKEAIEAIKKKGLDKVRDEYYIPKSISIEETTLLVLNEELKIN